MSSLTGSSLKSDELDMLAEILNIGAGGAAKVLGELMNNSHIELSIPSVNITTHQELKETYENLGGKSIISISFSDAFTGSASLLFSGNSGLNFSKEIAGELASTDEILSMKEGILKEVGNIVICGVLGHIAKIISGSLQYGLPVYLDDLKKISPEQSNTLNSNDVVLSANITFTIESSNSEGFLFIIFTKNTYMNFLNLVKDFFGFE